MSASPTATACSSTAPSATRRSRGFEPTLNPATEQPHRRDRMGRADDVAAAVDAARAAQPRWAALPDRRAGQVPVPHRPPHPGAGPRAGGGRDARRRQAAARVARRRHPARRRALLPLRRLGRQAALRRQRASSLAPLGVVRPDRPLELPAADGGLEARTGAGLRQHGDPQARRDDASDRAASGRDLPGGGAARRAWSRSCPATVRPAPRWCAPRASTRSRSPGPPQSGATSRPRWPGAPPG